MKLSDYTEELRWLQSTARENGEKLNFFQGLWTYKEVGKFLGISPKTVQTPEFRRHLPAIALWQSQGTEKRTGQQVLRWRPQLVIEFREQREQQVMKRLRKVG